MGVKVCKFGGTSLADAAQIRKCQTIIQADAERRFVVPSAPGKRHKSDQKITDLLYLCHSHASQGLAVDEVLKLIADRFHGIAADLGVDVDLAKQFEDIRRELAAGATADYAASRGEYLNGLIIAALLDYTFIDPVEVIHFDTKGRFNADDTQIALSARLKATKNAVIPGFFGSLPDGRVKTFSRGGSDITGSIVARAAGADVYENWTDVSGLLRTDPRIVANPQPIDFLSYRELRELAYSGASVLHDEAVFPVRLAKIPVNIRNINEPDDPGTMIVPDDTPISRRGITGIAGRKDFTVITVEKAMMNVEIGFGRRLLAALEDHGVNLEHVPTGIDTMSVVVKDSEIEGKLDDVLKSIDAECRPDSVEVLPEMALVATVGRGMAYTPGMAATLFNALAAADINVRMIDQGSSEINIIVGVDCHDFEKAVKAIYAAFVG